MIRALAFLLLTACSPQVEVEVARVEVPRDPPLDCEGKLPGMFGSKNDCVIMERMEEWLGSGLAGPPPPQEGNSR